MPATAPSQTCCLATGDRSAVAAVGGGRAESRGELVAAAPATQAVPTLAPAVPKLAGAHRITPPRRLEIITY